MSSVYILSNAKNANTFTIKSGKKITIKGYISRFEPSLNEVTPNDYNGLMGCSLFRDFIARGVYVRSEVIPTASGLRDAKERYSKDTSDVLDSVRNADNNLEYVEERVSEAQTELQRPTVEKIAVQMGAEPSDKSKKSKKSK